jgi:UTP--glucose-1-phosphate uridylyltransferase
MKKENLYALRFEGERYDMGNKLGFLEANIKSALRDPELRDDVISMIKKELK